MRRRTQAIDAVERHIAEMGEAYRAFARQLILDGGRGIVLNARALGWLDDGALFTWPRGGGLWTWHAVNGRVTVTVSEVLRRWSAAFPGGST